MKITGQLAPATGQADGDNAAAAGFAHLNVLDISRADAPATIVGGAVIGLDPRHASFPIDFEVDVDGPIEDGHTYSIRATIRGGDGTLRWTTDTVYPVDLASLAAADSSADQTIDVGTLSLVAVGQSSAGGPQPTRRVAPDVARDLVGVWSVTRIDQIDPVAGRAPAIEFADDGAVAGTTGCNRFTAQWTVDEGRLSVGPAATTRRACVPELNAQEAAMLVLLADAVAAAVTIDGDQLTIETTGGHRLVAVRAGTTG